jgi:hypothetical protein
LRTPLSPTRQTLDTRVACSMLLPLHESHHLFVTQAIYQLRV